MTAPEQCRSGAFCGTCRSGASGRLVRRLIGTVLGLPGPVEQCPFGRPWGAAAAGATIAGRAARPLAVQQELVETHCENCQDHVWDAATADWPAGLPGCRRVRACGGRPSFKTFHAVTLTVGGCPVGKW